MRLIAVVGLILAASVVSACGGGAGSESVETSSGAPPRLLDLKSSFEHLVRTRNEVSALDCEDDQEPDIMAADHTVLDCRTSPDENYSQVPHGICKRLR